MNVVEKSTARPNLTNWVICQVILQIVDNNQTLVFKLLCKISVYLIWAHIRGELQYFWDRAKFISTLYKYLIWSHWPRTDEIERETEKCTSVINHFRNFKFKIISYQLNSILFNNIDTNRMSTAARRRLMRDFKRLQEDPPAGVSVRKNSNFLLLQYIRY